MSPIPYTVLLHGEPLFRNLQRQLSFGTSDAYRSLQINPSASHQGLRASTPLEQNLSNDPIGVQLEAPQGLKKI
jgi:hypothetical protein